MTQDDIKRITAGLEEGAADEVFRDLAVYLEQNTFKLSDDVLRLYAEKELFECFVGRGQHFTTLLVN